MIYSFGMENSSQLQNSRKIGQSELSNLKSGKIIPQCNGSLHINKGDFGYFNKHLPIFRFNRVEAVIGVPGVWYLHRDCRAEASMP